MSILRRCPKSAGSGERHRCSLGPPVQIVVLTTAPETTSLSVSRPGAVPGDTPLQEKLRI